MLRIATRVRHIIRSARSSSHCAISYIVPTASHSTPSQSPPSRFFHSNIIAFVTSSCYMTCVQVNILAIPPYAFPSHSGQGRPSQPILSPPSRRLVASELFPVCSPSYAHLQDFPLRHTIQRVRCTAGMPIVDFRSVPFLFKHRTPPRRTKTPPHVNNIALSPDQVFWFK
jgi:hypothetical protein